MVGLKNTQKEIRLAAASCESSSENNIFKSISEVLTEYNVWHVIKRIVSDTTAINTGKVNGIVVKLQRKMQILGLITQQYIGCQHHVLDRLLHQILDYFFPCQSKSPTVQYDFILKILNLYEELKREYNGEADVIVDKILGWRAAFKLLYVSCLSFPWYKVCFV